VPPLVLICSLKALHKSRVDSFSITLGFKKGCILSYKNNSAAL
jgi:hypothetical protein